MSSDWLNAQQSKNRYVVHDPIVIDTPIPKQAEQAMREEPGIFAPHRGLQPNFAPQPMQNQLRSEDRIRQMLEQRLNDKAFGRDRDRLFSARGGQAKPQPPKPQQPTPAADVPFGNPAPQQTRSVLRRF